MADLALDLGGLRLKNPILPASGTFGLGHVRVFDIERLGAIVPKTITPHPRPGNPMPRLVESGGGLINAIGIPSVGLEHFLAHELPRYRPFSPPLVVSLSADTADGFAHAVERLTV
ncbi:MAG: dihydroorotate dehydrogenase, partial [Pseudomonadota bacterium]